MCFDQGLLCDSVRRARTKSWTGMDRPRRAASTPPSRGSARTGGRRRSRDGGGVSPTPRSHRSTNFGYSLQPSSARALKVSRGKGAHPEQHQPGTQYTNTSAPDRLLSRLFRSIIWTTRCPRTTGLTC